MGKMDRFWFGDQIEKTAEYFREHFPKEGRHAREQADKICENRFVFREHWEMERTHEEVHFPEKIVWDHIPAGDPEWIYALNRHTCFVILGKAWRLTGEEKYAAKYVQLLKDWMERVPLTQESRKDTWRSLEAGIRIEHWLKSFLLFENSPLFTEEIKQKAEKILYLHGEYLLETNTPFHKLSSWGILQNHGLVLLGLYFGQEAWVKEAVKRLDEEAYLQVFEDGSQWEQSPMYHCEVLYALMDSLLMLKRFEKKVPKRLEEKTKKMAYALACWCKPDGHIPCHGDSDDIDAADLLTEAALLFEDKVLKFLSGGLFYEDNLWNFGFRGAKNYEKMAAREPEWTSAVLSDAGNYLIRTRWDKEADYVRMHCGCVGSGHGHGDLLHVDYYSRGEDILIDPGRCTYVDSPMRKKLKMPSGHNTYCVDGKEFFEYDSSWSYSRTAHPVKGEYRFAGQANLAMAAHLGYLDQGLFATRKVITVKEGLLLIIDVCYGNGRHTYDSFYHFGRNGKVTLKENGRNGMARAHFQGQKAQAEIFVMKGTAEVTKEPCSSEYNLLETCCCLKTKYIQEGQASMITVISTAGADGQEITAELLPVKGVRSGKTYDSKEAEAVRLVKDGKEYVVILCHQELTTPEDYLTVGNYVSYGKVIVFSEENTERICLQY